MIFLSLFHSRTSQKNVDEQRSLIDRVETTNCFMGKEKVVKKSKRVLIKLLSRAGTGYFYTKSKNTRNTPGKLELLKFDPIVGKHVLFTETKLK
ncbi:50S ribosomal protein L33 (mitochondrial) [Galdieria sulphuraria]|uniref:Large ribosomal subunit protein bL33c n=1 Tax=Galdieria sulphuraria TaxID=130081 RepID=M2Y1X6_GALSU|nr:50S ribosomal protein L33 (mitochondrial) [Galdieria sulphuraria]EME29953.1 50S ribosomal protein L33 (mitochondrial) [Galdieria sulphuraria]|eukprot:XP_005706473.1 50S ribosomal protein L33 (mitochondrial) [Galdieria sulphuraria]